MSLSALRPLSFGETLDGAFALYRRHFATFVATGLLAFTPLFLLSAAIAAGFVSPELETLLNRILSTLSGILAFGALTAQASAAYLGQEVSVAAGFRAAGRRFRPVWASLVLQGLAIGLGLLLLVVPGVIAFIILFAMIPVVVLEGKNSSEAQGRSRELAKGGWRRVLGVMLTFTLITWVPVLGCAYLVGIAAVVAGTSTTATAVGGVAALIGFLVRAVAIPVQIIGTVILYYDRRVRTEALDLEVPGETAGALALA